MIPSVMVVAMLSHTVGVDWPGQVEAVEVFVLSSTKVPNCGS